LRPYRGKNDTILKSKRINPKRTKSYKNPKDGDRSNPRCTMGSMN